MAGEREHSSTTDRPEWGIGQVARSGASYLADLIARLVRRTFGALDCLAPAALGAVLSIGCGEGSAAEPKPAPVATELVAAAAPAAGPVSSEPKPIGQFDVTFYYVIGEDEVGPKAAATGKLPTKPPANSNEAAPAGAAPAAAGADADAETELAAIAVEPPPPERVTLYDGKTCAPIAEVDKEFAYQLALQGTDKLRDGRLLNVWAQNRCTCEHKPCYQIVENQQWGRAGTGRALEPFRTVAVDRTVVKLGSLLYIPLLEGRTMPGRAPWGGFVHDGCVVADDTGGGIKGNQIDLFVGRKGYYLGLSGIGGSHAWARHVEVFDGSKRCERKGRRIGRKSAAI